MFVRVRWSLLGWNVLVIGLILLVAGSLVYAALERSLQNDVDRALADPGLLRFNAPGLGLRPGVTGNDRRFYLITDLTGNVLVNPQQIGLASVPLPRETNFIQFYDEITVRGEPVRLFFRSIPRPTGELTPGAYVDLGGVSVGPVLRSPANPEDGGVIFVTGMSLQQSRNTLNVFLALLLTGGAVGLVLALVGAWFLAGRALIPVQRAFARQQEFVADAAHELRTPLTVLLAGTDLLSQHRAEPLATNDDLFDDLRAEIARMTRLTSDLLLLARTDLGDVDLAIGNVDLPGIAVEGVRRLIPLAQQSQVTLRCQSDSRALVVLADPDRLQQVLMILLDNALKHTPPGGAITLTVRCDGNAACLEVADTGEGIPADKLRRVFDRFYRVDPARTRANGGAGLGLAIARSLVEAHGGRLSLASDVGVGTVATVRLPLSVRDSSFARRVAARLTNWRLRRA